MIKEIKYKEKYELYDAGCTDLLGVFPSRAAAVEYNHRLMVVRAGCIKLIEQHNAKFKGTWNLYKTN